MQTDRNPQEQFVLEIEDLRIEYETSRGVLRAVDSVSLFISPGETLGLVGESGCGKSSLGKAIVGLTPSTGRVRITGRDLSAMSRAERKAFCRRVQMVFQDPQNSLDPRMRVGDSIGAPLWVHGLGKAAERRAKVGEIMLSVGLRPEDARRFPHEFSGGQRQRIGIARALILSPELVICDEPVSALDVSMQAQVLNILTRMKHDRGVSYLFISHDLAVVDHIADRVAVMYLGRIIELCRKDQLFLLPLHPYTQALIEAVPRISATPRSMEGKRVLQGDLPSPYAPPSGCRFRTRCPHAESICEREEPGLRTLRAGHDVACHFAERFLNPAPEEHRYERSVG